MADDFNAILRRMDSIERNQSDNAKSLTAVIENAHAIDVRIKALETLQFERRVDDAERNAREKAMQKDISDIREDVTTIKKGINRVLWAIATAVIVAFVGWMLRGNLHG